MAEQSIRDLFVRGMSGFFRHGGVSVFRAGRAFLLCLLACGSMAAGATGFPGHPANRNTFGAGVSLLGGSLGYGSVFVQYGIGRSLQAETGAGPGALYGGLGLFPLPSRRPEGISPYMGLFAGYTGRARSGFRKGAYMYMPAGVRCLHARGWFFSAEVAATTAGSLGWGPLYAGIKFGYLFSGR